jgi:predicted kinase
MTTNKDRVQVRLDLTPDERQRLRVIAAHQGISMAEFSRRAVIQVMDQVEQEQKKQATAKILKKRQTENGER